ncbi:MAG TPA: MG2 domain-containing protein [Vicinamibacterales bacterium]|nr:MG2 domain-containing protein [Vicinamibacterales bacterium]
MSRARLFCTSVIAAFLIAATVAAQNPPLTVVNTGPQGPLDQLAQANEIRIVFSEPMVTLGRIPEQVTAPFVRITPAIQGTFRWSGTTILIFTPDPKRPLPFATTYEVVVDATATAVSGRTLARPATFTLTTPTVRLLQTNWYRRGGTVNGAVVALLRFNQPVRAQDVAEHLTASLERHDWEPPRPFSADELQRLRALDPAAPDAFARKVAATRQVAAGGPAVGVRLTSDWDRQRFPAAPDLVAFETTTPVAPESWVKLTLDGGLPSPAGRATPGRAQSFTVRVERALFVYHFRCNDACDGDVWNPVVLPVPVTVTDFAAALRVTDITKGDQAVGKSPTPRVRRDFEPEANIRLTLEDAGFAAQPPDRRYAMTAPATLMAADGQTLGYTWLSIVDNWHSRAFTSFGDGHGVWEKDGGQQLPFYARNLRTVTQWAAPLRLTDLMPRLLELQNSRFSLSPSGEGIVRQLGVTADRVQSHGLNLTSALGAGGTGLVWTAVREGDVLPRTRRLTGDEARTRASIIQVTNLGITVKDSPQNTLIFVTRLDTGAPVSGASVSIIRTDNSTFWRGTTGADGVAIAPDTPLRDTEDWWQLKFVVTAEKDGDIAYVGSDWNEGLLPWDFGTGINLGERDPLLRGSVFTDRGVYRLGEEVHFKAILRHNTPTGVRLLPENTPVLMTVRDVQNRLVDERVVRVTPWSSAEWTFKLPATGTLGNYSLRAILESDKPKPKTPEERRPGVTPGPDEDDRVPYYKMVNTSFLVAAYRRPDFRVDVSLAGQDAIAGDQVKGVVTARYLFGASMGARPVTWRYSKSPGYNAPSTITGKFGDDRWVFVGRVVDDKERVDSGDIRREETTLQTSGDLPLTLDTRRDAGVPYVYSLEGDVEDVSRQHIANRASLTVHPAPWYIGLRRPGYFVDQKSGLKTEVVAVRVDGTTAPGVPVDVTLTQVQWTSVRRAEGNGFYTWDTQRRDVPAGSWTVTSAAEPVPLDIPFKNGGFYMLEARGRGEDGRFAVTRTSFYVLGDGYTAWARYDHNRIDLVPERQTYKPGDTARIMIQSPWEQATALVTTEREGIRSHRQFALTSTQQSISIPITGNDIPNVFVSVLLVKGRTTAAPANGAATDPGNDASDPGKPAFRLGYVELKVEDRSKRLSVAVTTSQQEYRPASKANVRVDVKDAGGRGVASEVTLWAVDYGVLSLTGYRAPDVAGSVYVEKSLQVFNEDNRQRIVSRRVLTPKGATDGGGGGDDAGAGTLRKDFRVLAFWLGSVTTGSDGRARVNVTLPESLTTYRIMAVAADRGSRFGSGDTEVRTNKPVTLKPTFPRFMAVGDTAFFGAVVGSQLRANGTAVVSMRSLDPRVLEVTGAAEQRVTVNAGGTVEVRFSSAAKSIGRARIQMRAQIGGEGDAFEDVIPVEVLASPETVAAYGEAAAANREARETIRIPAGVVGGFGGLDVEVSSTAMVGLGEGARYLVEYPYGCAEQKASTSLALILAGDLGDAFSLPGMDPARMRPTAQSTLKELEKFQCASGGFAYWPGECRTVSPYLTAYVLSVMKTAVDLKYDVDRPVRERAYDYLHRELAATPPAANDGWWPAYSAWQAFAVKVLVEGGRNEDSHITRLYGYRDRMPVFGLAYLHDALIAKGETTGDRVTDLRRRMSNAILPEGGSAHVEELADPYLLWFWNSNVRSTSIVLNSLVKGDVSSAPMRQMVRWMMAARKDGRWGNTQENALAMEALVAYYRKYEPVVPDFRAVVSLGARELAREEFRGRSTESSTTRVPMAQVLAAGAAGTEIPLTFTRDGEGTLFYTTRLRYAADTLHQQGLDAGFAIERRYEPYVADGSRPAATSYAAGDLVRVTLTFRLTKERRYVAVTDPLPAGFEAVETWFATTARDLAAQTDQQTNAGGNANDWRNWWRFSGFDHVERHDDRVQLFATRLAEGLHEFSYVVRATTAGTFRTAPARAEEMYEPEVFGRTATTMIEVKR